MQEKRKNNNKSQYNSQVFRISVGCAFLALIIRLIYLIKYPVPIRDAYAYEHLLNNFANNDILPIDCPPLALFIFNLTRDSFYEGIIKNSIILNMVLGVFIVLITINILFEINKSNITNCLLGILIATHPSYIEYSCESLRENQMILFSSIGIFFLVKYLNKKWIVCFIASSVFIAFAMLCRYEAMELSIIASIFLLYKQKEKKVISLIAFSVIQIAVITLVYITFNQNLLYFINSLIYKYNELKI